MNYLMIRNGAYTVWNFKKLFCFFISSKTLDIPMEVVNVLVFLEDFVHYSSISRKVRISYIDL